MVLDVLSNAARYRSLHPRLALGFDWLARIPADLPAGRHAIDGDEVYVLVQEYETGAPAEKRFESHRRNLDIQYVVSGVETMYVASVPGLVPATEYDAQTDLIFYQEPGSATALHCPAGMFTIFWPNDGHKGGCVAGNPAAVRKMVVKVRV
jgi:biofilm protein TabA